MKHIYFTFLGCIFFFSSAFSQSDGYQITGRTAKLVAENFFFEQTIEEQDSAVGEVLSFFKDAHKVFYAVNFTEGFVLVSAARNIWPVLAWSNRDHFHFPENEENVKAWLGQYEKQIVHAIVTKAAPTPEIMKAWNRYTDRDFTKKQRPDLKSVAPLLTSKWNQGKYYNELCPDDPAGPGGHAYAGCVATAMGQVMYYFRHPQTGEGSYTYYHPVYDTISANFGSTTYRWNEMVNSLSESNLAVAELLFHLGVSVDMVYGPNGSGMYNHKAAYSLRTHFRYAPETQYVFRDSTNMNWDSLMVTHLNRRIPMYYAGWSQPHIYGHAFVVDGYQGEGYYHFNWGWGGSFDGYFYTNELTPGGSNFNLAQELIINCYPDTINNQYPLYCEGFTLMNHHEGTFDDGSGHVYYYASNSNCTYLIDPQNEIDSITSITLTFQRFDLNDNHDFLFVYDGENETAPLLAALTGNVIPSPLNSSGNKLFLKFESATNDTARGFFASYKSEKPVWCSGMTTISEPDGWLSDGSGSFHYYNGITCLWYINPPGASEVTLVFTKLDTEPVMDKVRIFDPTNNTLLAEFSGYYAQGEMPDPITAVNGEMFITFTTDSYGRADGWEAYYYTDLTTVSSLATKSSFDLYPNPSTGIINLLWTNEQQKLINLKIFNAGGQVVFFSRPDQATALHQIDLTELPSGIYLIQVHHSAGYEIKKLVLE